MNLFFENKMNHFTFFLILFYTKNLLVLEKRVKSEQISVKYSGSESDILRD
jgi:hypothetical protein